MRFILREGRLDDLKSKNPLLSSEIDELASSDLTGNLKYLDWEVKQLKNGFSVNDIVPTVQIFHRKQGKFKNRDINAYKTLKELEDEVKEIESTKTGSEARKEAKTGADTVYKDENVIVKFIPSKEASCQYGKNTKWCITMQNAPYFEQYSGANVVFYFVMRKSPLGNKFDKVAIVVMRDQENKITSVEFYDATDEKYTEIVKPLTPEIVDVAKAHAAKQPKGLIAKVRSGEATEEEELKAIKMYPDSFDLFASNIKSKKILKVLAHDKNLKVRYSVADNPNMPLEELTMLANDRHDDVRHGVALNPNASAELLNSLASDKSLDVRYGVAKNPSTSSETLMLMIKNNNANVRWYVADNPNVPLEILSLLMNDDVLYVRNYAKERYVMKSDAK